MWNEVAALPQASCRVFVCVRVGGVWNDSGEMCGLRQLPPCWWYRVAGPGADTAERPVEGGEATGCPAGAEAGVAPGVAVAAAAVAAVAVVAAALRAA